MSNNHKRAEARERARLALVARKKRERRTRILVRSGLAAGIVAVLAIVAVVIAAGVKPPTPGPRNMASDGIVVGEGYKAQRTSSLAAGDAPVPTKTEKSNTTAQIRIYADYLCPACGAFEKQYGDYIDGLVKSGGATVEYHPVAILDAQSLGSKYSTRAAAAAACVADLSPDSFHDVNRALFAAQPAEGTTGLDDEQLSKLVREVKGLSNSKKIADCIADETYTGWVTAATKRALSGPLPGTDVKKLRSTPTVTVNGSQWDGAKSGFEEFVPSIVGESKK